MSTHRETVVKRRAEKRCGLLPMTHTVMEPVNPALRSSGVALSDEDAVVVRFNEQEHRLRRHTLDVFAETALPGVWYRSRKDMSRDKQTPGVQWFRPKKDVNREEHAKTGNGTSPQADTDRKELEEDRPPVHVPTQGSQGAPGRSTLRSLHMCVTIGVEA